MISIVTGGKFWPQPGHGLSEGDYGVGGSDGGLFEEKKKPVVIINSLKEEIENINIVVEDLEEIL
jgi:hypothetical protein